MSVDAFGDSHEDVQILLWIKTTTLVVLDRLSMNLLATGYP